MVSNIKEVSSPKSKDFLDEDSQTLPQPAPQERKTGGGDTTSLQQRGGVGGGFG